MLKYLHIPRLLLAVILVAALAACGERGRRSEQLMRHAPLAAHWTIARQC
jgi:hypothetical protein